LEVVGYHVSLGKGSPEVENLFRSSFILFKFKFFYFLELFQTQAEFHAVNGISLQNCATGFIQPFAATLHTVRHQRFAIVYAKGFYTPFLQPLCTRLATSVLQ
jgi:hypothetical protein